MKFTSRGVPDFCPFPASPPWLSALLRLRGIDTEEKARLFLSPSLENLHDPFLLENMDKAVHLLEAAIASQDPILIWGDYDADGVCATAILHEALKDLGAKSFYHLPSREREGYGLNVNGIRKAAEVCRLLVTVDCGISNREEVSLAKSLGVSVIVTDHHALPPQLPEADAVISPLLGQYPCPFLCGAGVALKIVHALQGMFGVRKQLDLAALATVADVVPLLDENRIIVTEGLRQIESTTRPGLQALLDASAVQFPLRSEHLAFRLGPRLNAAGRMAEAGKAARLLLTRDPAEARALASQLEQWNSQRQSLEKEITAAAVIQAESREDFGTSRCIVVSGNSWNPGLIGLTAGRLCEKYHLPAIVLSIRGETATGSCRSIPGVHIYETLGRCADLLERYGGHAQAAGLTLRTDRIDVFRDRLNQILQDTYDESVFEPEILYDLSIPFQHWTPETLSQLSALEPTGCGNPAPLFLLSGVSVQSMRKVGRDFSHLQLSLLDRDHTLLKGIAFSQGSIADEGFRTLDCLYRPIENNFHGNISIEAQILALRPPSEKENLI